MDNPFLVAYEVFKMSGPDNQSAFESNIVVYSQNMTTKVYTILEKCTPNHWGANPELFNRVRASIASQSLIYCLPLSYSHWMSVSQEATFAIDVAYRCRTNCSSIPETSILFRPIILDTLINPQEREEYLINFLEKRQYY